MRIFPEQEERVETGVIQFDGDWPGVFIRGDNALAYGMFLRQLLEHSEAKSPGMNLKSLVKLLNSCDVRSITPEVEKGEEG